MTTTADRIESALLSMHATDRHCAVPSTVIRGSINLDGPVVSLAEVKSVCHDDPRFECAPNRKASFYLVPGASDETVQRAAIAVLDGCDEPLDYDTLASRTADMVRSLSSAGCGTYASPGRLAASIARAVNDERIFAVTVGATIGDSTFSARRPLVAPEPTDAPPVCDGAHDFVNGVCQSCGVNDAPSNADHDNAVRAALALESSYAEIFDALDRALYDGNAGSELDDALDASLTRLIDSGEVEAIDRPAPAPRMLSRRTYALTGTPVDPAPSIDLSGAFCDDESHVVDTDGFCVTCSRWHASALDSDARAVLANLSPPVASPLPTNRERRVAASRELQAALSTDRAAVRSTAKGTAAPFAGVVLSTEHAAHVAFKLRVLDALLTASNDDEQVADALNRALARARR
jgi:hypothetical protein